MRQFLVQQFSFLKSKQNWLIALIFFIFGVVYVTYVYEAETLVNQDVILQSFSTFFKDLTEGEKIVEEMNKYSDKAKQSIRYIKKNLLFRPPLSPLPFVRMHDHNIVAPNYKMANCVVEKSMCTQMNAILCYLLDSEEFLANNRSIETENWTNAFCYYKNNYETWNELQAAVPEWLETTFIVRDPVNRFISAFIDKCVNENVECYGCYANFTCVVESVFESSVQMSRNHSNIEDRSDSVEEMSYEGRHFAPLTWYCDLWDRFEEYHFIKYGEDSESFNRTRLAVLDFFKKHGVEAEKLEYIDYSFKTRSSHATKESYSDLRTEIENTLFNSTKHLEMMAHMYYYDYLAFGFQPPVDIYIPKI